MPSDVHPQIQEILDITAQAGIPKFQDLKNIELTRQIIVIDIPILIAADLITSQIKSDKNAIIPDNLKSSSLLENSCLMYSSISLLYSSIWVVENVFIKLVTKVELFS